MLTSLTSRQGHAVTLRLCGRVPGWTTRALTLAGSSLAPVGILNGRLRQSGGLESFAVVHELACVTLQELSFATELPCQALGPTQRECGAKEARRRILLNRQLVSHDSL